MSKKDQHIKKYLNAKLPEPEIQADDAWAEMEDMLGDTFAPNTEAKEKERLKYLLKYGLIFFLVFSVITGTWLFLADNQEIKANHILKFQQRHTDNSQPNKASKETGIEIQENLLKGKDSLKISTQNIGELSVRDSFSVSNEKIKKRIAPRNPSLIADLRDTANIIHPDLVPNKPGNGKNKKDQITEISKSRKVKNKLNRAGVSETAVPTSFPENFKSDKSSENSKERTQNTSEKPSDKIASQSSYSGEKSNLLNRDEEIRPVRKIEFRAQKFIPNSIHFAELKQKQEIAIPQKTKSKKDNQTRFQSNFFKTMHIGLEWNASSSFRNTKYILRGTDNMSRAYLLAIPGIWISKDLSKHQSINVNFSVYQPYFGGMKVIQQDSDSASNIIRTRMIKAAGINLSAQYTYRIYSNWAVSGGFAYSKLNQALFQQDFQNYNGEIISMPKLSLQKNDLTNLIQTNLITFKTGLVFTPGRYQFGANLVVPLTNISFSTLPLRTVNGQIFFRFRLK